ncbi:MAG: hypothetical protein IRY86_08360 [Thermorudis peleae]|nr:hypothetical protein [Thermorudis peleae]
MGDANHVVETILAHLCAKGVYGDVTEWCETRADCVFVVTCPDCGQAFTLTEDELALLLQRSRERQACGVALAEDWSNLVRRIGYGPA